jgi:hypothetical protein
MNQFFNLNRFNLLVVKHWADNKNRYGLSVLAFMGVLILWFLLSILTGDADPMGVDVQVISYFVLLFGAGTFYASQYFSELGSHTKGSNFLLVPASIFEKILCAVLYNIILFFVVFTVAYYLVDMVMVTLTNFFIDSGIKKASVANVFSLMNKEFNEGADFNLLLVFFSIQSIFLLGSVYFSKYSFIKTIISGFVTCFIVFFLVYFLYEFLPKGEYSSPFLTSYRIHVDGDIHLIQLPGWLASLVWFLVMYAIAPFLWIVTYYRLKEKQV